MALLDLRHKALLDSIASAALPLQGQQFTPQEMTNTLWSFAAMKCHHEPLMQALASSSLARMPQVTTQNLVNAAWSLDVLAWPAFDRLALTQVVTQFLTACDNSLGVEWVTLATIVKDRDLVAELPSFMAGFRSRVLDPALAGLDSIHKADTDQILATEIKQFQDWVVGTQTPHLGAGFTPDAIWAAGAANRSFGPFDDSWLSKAREAVLQVAWWSCPHAAVSSHGVAAWVAAQLQVGDTFVEEPGRVYFADDSAEHSILVERMLQPIFLQVPRNGHAERRGLIDLLRSVARSFKQGNAEGWANVQGGVQLYASHYPCISCLVVIAQFTRRLPQVIVQVDFDNVWSSWIERTPPATAPDLLIMGTVA